MKKVLVKGTTKPSLDFHKNKTAKAKVWCVSKWLTKVQGLSGYLDDEKNLERALLTLVCCGREINALLAKENRPLLNTVTPLYSDLVAEFKPAIKDYCAEVKEFKLFELGSTGKCLVELEELEAKITNLKEVA